MFKFKKHTTVSALDTAPFTLSTDVNPRRLCRNVQCQTEPFLIKSLSLIKPKILGFFYRQSSVYCRPEFSHSGNNSTQTTVSIVVLLFKYELFDFADRTLDKMRFFCRFSCSRGDEIPKVISCAIVTNRQTRKKKKNRSVRVFGRRF